MVFLCCFGVITKNKNGKADSEEYGKIKVSNSSTAIGPFSTGQSNQKTKAGSITTGTVVTVCFCFFSFYLLQLDFNIQSHFG